MEDSPAPAAQVTGKYPVKLRPEAFKRGIDSFEKKLTTAFFTHRRIVTLHTAMPLSFSPGIFVRLLKERLICISLFC